MTMLVVPLLSLLASLAVHLCIVYRACHRPSVRHRPQDTGPKARELPRWHRMQVKVCIFDSLLILAMIPLFVVYAQRRAAIVSIWNLAFQSAGTTFAMTAAMVSRPVFFAAMTSSNFFTTSSRYVAISVIMLAVLTMVGSSIFTAVLCSSANLRDLGSCTTSRSIKFVILFFEYLATVCASIILGIAAVARTNPQQTRDLQDQGHKSPTVGHRAPSLSLLIHTQPDPWTREIHIDIPDQQRLHSKQAVETDNHPSSGLSNTPDESVQGDDASKAMQGVLRDFGGSDRMTDAATTSLGFGSAVASSGNPYHVGSTLSLATRDALSRPEQAEFNLAQAEAGSSYRYQTSTSKPSCLMTTLARQICRQKHLEPTRGPLQRQQMAVRPLSEEDQRGELVASKKIRFDRAS